MPTPAKKTNKSITFTPEAVDQTLLVAIEQALSEEQYDSFSVLCKQALQQTLLATQSAQLNDSIDLEVVLAPIQQQVAQLEAKLLASQSQRLDELNQQLAQTTQKLEVLQTRSDRWFSELQAGISALPSAAAVDSTDSLNLESRHLLQAVEQSNTNLQRQVEAVQNQLSSWKQPASNQTTEYLNQLTSQLIHLTTQVEAIETKISQQFEGLQSQLSQNQPALPVPPPRVTKALPEPPSAQAGIPAAPIAPEPVLIVRESAPKAATAASSHESDPILSRLSSLLEDF